jgi:hypothetical protein
VNLTAHVHCVESDYGPFWLGEIRGADGSYAQPWCLSPECDSEADAVEWCRAELLARGVREPVVTVEAA